jgi:hypothetical protein
MQCLSTLALSAFIGSVHQKFDNIEEHFVKAQMVEYTVYAMASTIRGRLHGACTVVELSPANQVEFFCDYMDDFNPGGCSIHCSRTFNL